MRSYFINFVLVTACARTLCNRLDVQQIKANSRYTSTYEILIDFTLTKAIDNFKKLISHKHISQQENIVDLCIYFRKKACNTGTQH